MSDFEWESDDRVRLARANYMACAYNLAVNYGSSRELKKMHGLLRAINYYERVEGAVKLELLVQKGVIDYFTPCPSGCVVRPGGLFHDAGCENDCNHPVSKDRQQKAREMLPGGRDGNAGWRAASVSLVGNAEG